MSAKADAWAWRTWASAEFSWTPFLWDDNAGNLFSQLRLKKLSCWPFRAGRYCNLSRCSTSAINRPCSTILWPVLLWKVEAWGNFRGMEANALTAGPASISKHRGVTSILRLIVNNRRFLVNWGLADRQTSHVWQPGAASVSSLDGTYLRGTDFLDAAHFLVNSALGLYVFTFWRASVYLSSVAS